MKHWINWISCFVLAVLLISGSGLAQAQKPAPGVCHVGLDGKIVCGEPSGKSNGPGLIAYVYGDETFTNWGKRLEIRIKALVDYSWPLLLTIERLYTRTFDGQTEHSYIACDCGGNPNRINGLVRFEGRPLHTEVFDWNHGPGKYEFIVTLRDEKFEVVETHRVVAFHITTPRGGESYVPRIDYVEKTRGVGGRVVYTLHGSFSAGEPMYYVIGVPFSLGMFSNEPTLISYDGRTARVDGPTSTDGMEFSVSVLVMDTNGYAYLLPNADKSSRR